MERTGAKAERIYQSGKTRRRNANKKKCLQKRRMMARSAMASHAQNPSIQVVDLDVPNELSNLSISVKSTTKAHSNDTLIAEHKQTEKETALSVMETTETQSVSSDEFYDVQIVEDDEEKFEEYEPEQVYLGYTARCVRIKDNTFAYAGQTEW